MSPSINVVIVNWKRPRNVEQLINFFSKQPTPCRILIADCHLEPRFALQEQYLSKVDDVISVRKNLGPGSRFIPAFAYAGKAKYTYFHDDDALPGNDILTKFLSYAEEVKDFACLGHQGRRFRIRKRRNLALYFTNCVLRSKEAYVPVDSTVRFHFVRNDLFHHVLQFEQEWLLKCPNDADLLVEDDLLLNLGIQYYTHFPSYLVPLRDGYNDHAYQQELGANNAHSSRPWHKKFRRKFVVNAYRTLKWRRPEPNRLLTTPLPPKSLPGEGEGKTHEDRIVHGTDL